VIQEEVASRYSVICGIEKKATKAERKATEAERREPVRTNLWVEIWIESVSSIQKAFRWDGGSAGHRAISQLGSRQNHRGARSTAWLTRPADRPEDDSLHASRSFMPLPFGMNIFPARRFQEGSETLVTAD